MENYDDVVDYSPEPGVLHPWTGTFVSPIHPLSVQLEEELSMVVRGDFFSQFPGVSGFYHGKHLEAYSWIGGAVGSMVVSLLISSTSSLPGSVAWCGSSSQTSEISFSPILCGFSPSSATKNLSW